MSKNPISRSEALKDVLREHSIDRVGATERAFSLMSRSYKGESKKTALELAISMLDLTTLEGSDTVGTIRDLVKRASKPDISIANLPTTAAICVYGDRVSIAKKFLTELNSPVKLAAVSTAFPSGRNSLKLKLEETSQILKDGAEEIDMVIDRAAFLSGDYGRVYDEIKEVATLCADYKAKLKVIFETGELNTPENINKASWLAIHAGADFIKTSTGKVNVNATPLSTLILLRAARDAFDRYGLAIGVKPAGGIKTSKDALGYLSLVEESAGDKWLTNSLFRFGASSLLSDLLLQRQKIEFDGYSSSNYVPGASTGY